MLSEDKGDYYEAIKYYSEQKVYYSSFCKNLVFY